MTTSEHGHEVQAGEANTAELGNKQQVQGSGYTPRPGRLGRDPDGEVGSCSPRLWEKGPAQRS